MIEYTSDVGRLFGDAGYVSDSRLMSIPVNEMTLAERGRLLDIVSRRITVDPAIPVSRFPQGFSNTADYYAELVVHQLAKEGGTAANLSDSIILRMVDSIPMDVTNSAGQIIQYKAPGYYQITRGTGPDDPSIATISIARDRLNRNYIDNLNVLKHELQGHVTGHASGTQGTHSKKYWTLREGAARLVEDRYALPAGDFASELRSWGLSVFDLWRMPGTYQQELLHLGYEGSLSFLKHIRPHLPQLEFYEMIRRLQEGTLPRTTREARLTNQTWSFEDVIRLLPDDAGIKWYGSGGPVYLGTGGLTDERPWADQGPLWARPLRHWVTFVSNPLTYGFRAWKGMPQYNSAETMRRYEASKETLAELRKARETREREQEQRSRANTDTFGDRLAAKTQSEFRRIEEEGRGARLVEGTGWPEEYAYRDPNKQEMLSMELDLRMGRPGLFRESGLPGHIARGSGKYDVYQDMERKRLTDKLRYYSQGGEVPIGTFNISNPNRSFFKSRGTDTVPAVLTRGEYVVKASEAQKNLGVLNHINSGLPLHSYASAGGPIYRWRGGEVRREDEWDFREPGRRFSDGNMQDTMAERAMSDRYQSGPQDNRTPWDNQSHAVDWSEAIGGLNVFEDRFESAIASLSTAVGSLLTFNLPNDIQMAGSHNVSVNFNGASMLQGLEPTIRSWVMEAVTRQIGQQQNINHNSGRPEISA
jgi:hypothetical protein